MARWLLPFTRGVNVRAIDLVLRLAEQCGATLVAASLIILPDARKEQRLRLEYLQQSKDFLEVVRWKAARYRIPVESHEVWTSDVQERVKRLVLDLHCDSIVLVTNGKQEMLLDAHEMKDLLMGNTPASLVLVRIPESRQSAVLARLRTQFLSWARKFLGQRSATIPTSTLPIEQGLLQDKQERILERNSL